MEILIISSVLLTTISLIGNLYIVVLLIKTNHKNKKRKRK